MIYKNSDRLEILGRLAFALFVRVWLVFGKWFGGRNTIKESIIISISFLKMSLSLSANRRCCCRGIL